MRKAIAVSCVVAIGAVLGGCSTPREVVRPLSLTVGVQQYREDQVAQRLQLLLTNNDTRPVQLTSLNLVWAGFNPQPATRVSYTLTPGLPVALAIPEPRASCTTAGAPLSAPVVQVTAIAPTAATTIPVTNGLDVLQQARATECVQQNLNANLSMEFDDSWTPYSVKGVPAVDATILVWRKLATSDISITDLQGTVLLTISPIHQTRPLGLLGYDAQVLFLPVRLQAARCDLHALGEAKKPFAFVVGVRIGRGPRLPYDLTPDAAGKARLWRLIFQGCRVP